MGKGVGIGCGGRNNGQSLRWELPGHWRKSREQDGSGGQAGQCDGSAQERLQGVLGEAGKPLKSQGVIAL